MRGSCFTEISRHSLRHSQHSQGFLRWTWHVLMSPGYCLRNVPRTAAWVHTQKGKVWPSKGPWEKTAVAYIFTQLGTETRVPTISYYSSPVTSSMGLCPELASTGTCPLLDCKWSHDTSLFCADCNILCTSRSELNSHLKGRRHQNVVQNRANKSGHVCRICNMVIGTNPTVWTMHIEGKRHRNKARNLGTTEVTEDSPISDTWCDVCAMCLPTRQSAEAHRESPKHIKRTRLAEVGGRIKESQQSKYGVLVSHDSGVVDMPFVDVETISEAFSRTTEIKITADSPHSRLASVRFLSSGTGVGRQSW